MCFHDRRARRPIWCCGCQVEVQAVLTDGVRIYPHRADLASLPFWLCEACGNFVGCHHKTADRTRPLGVIPNEDIRQERKRIHALLDPLWQQGGRNRGQVYREIGRRLGREFHTAEIRSLDEARAALAVITELAGEIRA